MSHLVYDAISQMLMKCLKGILGFNNMLLVHFFLYLNSYYLLLTQVLTRLGKTDSFKKKQQQQQKRMEKKYAVHKHFAAFTMRLYTTQRVHMYLKQRKAGPC